MVEIGDKGIVFGSGSPYAQFVPVSTPNVGDRVILVPLDDGRTIAVPMLQFNIGDMVWVGPEFRFAGFDWKLDFNFQLIPLVIGIIIPPIGDYDLSFESGVFSPAPTGKWVKYCSPTCCDCIFSSDDKQDGLLSMLTYKPNTSPCNYPNITNLSTLFYQNVNLTGKTKMSFYIKGHTGQAGTGLGGNTGYLFVKIGSDTYGMGSSIGLCTMCGVNVFDYYPDWTRIELNITAPNQGPNKQIQFYITAPYPLGLWQLYIDHIEFS